MYEIEKIMYTDDDGKNPEIRSDLDQVHDLLCELIDNHFPPKD